MGGRLHTELVGVLRWAGEVTPSPSLRVARCGLLPALSQRDLGPELQRELCLCPRGSLQPLRRLLHLHPGLAGRHLRAALPRECQGGRAVGLGYFSHRNAQRKALGLAGALDSVTGLSSLWPLSCLGPQPCHLSNGIGVSSTNGLAL